jgi:hypothetical protein
MYNKSSTRDVYTITALLDVGAMAEYVRHEYDRWGYYPVSAYQLSHHQPI